MFSFLKTKKSAGIRVTAAVHRLISQGNAARDNEDWDKAAAFFRKAVSASPELAHVWVQLGHAEKEQERYCEAEAAYARAALLSPEASDPYLHLGHIYKLLGNVPSAVISYMRAARQHPSDSNAIEELQRFVGGATPFGRSDLISLLRYDIFGNDPASTTGTDPAKVLLDVSALVAAAMAGRDLAKSGLVTHHLISALSDLLGSSMEMGAHILGHGRWIRVAPTQMASLSTLSTQSGALGRQAVVNDLDLAFLLSEPLKLAEGVRIIDLDADHAPADHALFIGEARRRHGARYIAFGNAVSKDVATQADRVIHRGSELPSIDTIQSALNEGMEQRPIGTPMVARPNHIERIGADGRHFRVGTGWLPPMDWGAWAILPGGELEIALPEMHHPRLYLRLRALPKELTRYTVSLTNGREIHGEINDGQHKWQVIDDLPVENGVARMMVRGEDSRLVASPGAAHKLPATIGVTDFMVCERDDAAARMALLQAEVMGDFSSLY